MQEDIENMLNLLANTYKTRINALQIIIDEQDKLIEVLRNTINIIQRQKQ